MKSLILSCLKLILLVLPGVLLASSQPDAVSGVMVKPAAMRDGPALSAASIMDLVAEAKVAVYGRDGGWYEIKAEDSKGWVEMLAVRFEKSPYRPGKMGASALFSVVKSGHSDVTSSAGVRGLGEEELKASSHDYEQLDAFLKLSVSQKAAKEFARANKLTINEVAVATEEDES